jgi:hypothetical protein
MPRRLALCRRFPALAALAIVWGGSSVRAAGPSKAAPAERTSPAPSFRREVMAVLARGGCNSGACHGNQNGKGGFKLSLRGQDPAFDYDALVRDQFGRRLDPTAPDESLLLRKPTAQVAHGGGRRFNQHAPEYALLQRWIAAGAPNDLSAAAPLVELEVTPRSAVLVSPADEVQLAVEARFADGTRRDVRGLAVFETSNRLGEVDLEGVVRRRGNGETTVLVRYLDRQAPVRLAFVPAGESPPWPEVAPANYIDQHIFAKLRALRLAPAAACSDQVFLRRAHLDLLGLLPTAEEARAFAADTAPDKRARLVERLLARPEFADHWALKWSDLLRNEEKQLDEKGVQNFHHWIRRSLAENKPLDQFVRELLTGRGSTYGNPAANFYRGHRDPVSRAEAVAQVFLGVRLQCAKCHNHPFDRWTQDDYYCWAAALAGVKYKIVENRRRDENDGHEFDGEQIVWLDGQATLTDPRSGRPAPPRLLGAASDPPEEIDRRFAELADWLTSPEHPQFAAAQANRVWSHLLGRGLVEPIDDFRATNPASHPELLAALAHDFAASGFDLRRLIRTIMASETYRRSAEPPAGQTADDATFAVALVRRLSAEQLADALDRALGTTPHYSGYPEGVRAGQMAGVLGARGRRGRLGRPDSFLKLFGKPPRLLVCECERGTDTTLGQALQLISGPKINELLTEPDNRLGRLLSGGATPDEALEELYWSSLSRPPTEEERSAARARLDAGDLRSGLEDIAWAVVNSKEFLLRQ